MKTNNFKLSRIIYACLVDNVELFQLELAFSQNTFEKEFDNIMRKVIIFNSINVLKYLFAFYKIDLTNSEYLDISSQYNKVDTVKFLLKHGNYSITDLNKAMNNACKISKIEMFNLLLNNALIPEWAKEYTNSNNYPISSILNNMDIEKYNNNVILKRKRQETWRNYCE